MSIICWHVFVSRDSELSDECVDFKMMCVRGRKNAMIFDFDIFSGSKANLVSYIRG